MDYGESIEMHETSVSLKHFSSKLMDDIIMNNTQNVLIHFKICHCLFGCHN